MEDLCVDEAEGGLDDSKGHIDILVFVLKQDDDIDYVVKDSVHLLAKTTLLEHLLALLPLRFIDDLDEPDDLSQDAEDQRVDAFINLFLPLYSTICSRCERMTLANYRESRSLPRRSRFIMELLVWVRERERLRLVWRLSGESWLGFLGR